MLNNAKIGFCVGVLALFAPPGMALAQDAISAPAQKTIGSPKSEMIPSLAVINSHGASLQGNALTMTGVPPNSGMKAPTASPRIPRMRRYRCSARRRLRRGRRRGLEGADARRRQTDFRSIVFADRPVRAAGHVLTKDFLKECVGARGRLVEGDRTRFALHRLVCRARLAQLSQLAP